MIPLQDQTLRLLQIASHQTAPSGVNDLVSRMLAAIWKGELRTHSSPENLLLTAYQFQPHAFVVIREGCIPPAHDEGDGLPIDLTTWIDWAPTIGNPVLTKAALNLLAATSIEDFSHEMQALMRCLKVDRTAYGLYLDGLSRPLPTFWFRNAEYTPKEAAAAAVEQWLIELGRLNQTAPSSKDEIRERALRSFRYLTHPAFDTAWRLVAPRPWLKGGQRKKVSSTPRWPEGRFGRFLLSDQ